MSAGACLPGWTPLADVCGVVVAQAGKAKGGSPETAALWEGPRYLVWRRKSLTALPLRGPCSGLRLQRLDRLRTELLLEKESMFHQAVLEVACVLTAAILWARDSLPLGGEAAVAVAPRRRMPHRARPSTEIAARSFRLACCGVWRRLCGDDLSWFVESRRLRLSASGPAHIGGEPAPLINPSPGTLATSLAELPTSLTYPEQPAARVGDGTGLPDRMASNLAVVLGIAGYHRAEKDFGLQYI